MRSAALLGLGLASVFARAGFETPFHNPVYGVEGYSHHARRGNGHRITGFSGAYIRECNARNGVGSPALRKARAGK